MTKPPKKAPEVTSDAFREAALRGGDVRFEGYNRPPMVPVPWG